MSWEGIWAKDCSSDILHTMLYVISNANLVFDILYAHGVFIPSNAASNAIGFAYETGAICLHMFSGFQNLPIKQVLFPSIGLHVYNLAKVGYLQLASMAKSKQLKLFKIRPKVHMWFEIFMGMKNNGSMCLNPLATACWSDEDYIGRVSRVARSAHGATVSISCMRKTLGMYRSQFDKTLKCGRAAQKGEAPSDSILMRVKSLKVCRGLRVAEKLGETPEKPRTPWKQEFLFFSRF